MSEQLTPRAGGVLSADIAVPEHEREVRFYARVLGTGEQPLWRGDLMNNLGIPIIGLGPRSPEYAHLPLQWMPHIQVPDVAVSVQRTPEGGGQVLMHAQDDDGASHWAVLQDPQGAAFGVIPVVSSAEVPPGAAAPTADIAIGRVVWLDLAVPDAPAARDFYRGVIGWDVQDMEMEDAGERYVDYTMQGEGGVPCAGVSHARGLNSDLPPVWMLHLPVGDLDESLRHVSEEGGEVLVMRRGEDGNAVYGAVRDPVGACFALVRG